jgi:tetratricopeptide (TPR) repeat protein
MGVVYAATDTQLGRRVAVKVLPQEVTLDPIRRERFLREARSAAAVKHPAIAVVYDIGEVDGHVYIVMELVEGQSLRAALQHGPPALAHGIALAATLAEAVHMAHQAGVVHRDLKPENLMLDPSGALKILDFGIAKLDPSLVPAAQGVTREGAALGTPGYMSPEQVRGLDVDARTDIFAIGVIVYEMLGGRPPFAGPTLVDVLTATTRDEPAPLRSMDPRIPTALESLVHACLRKDPSHRPQSAAVLAAELRHIAQEPRQMESGGTLASDPSRDVAHAVPDPAAAMTSYPNIVPTLTDGSPFTPQKPHQRGGALLVVAVLGSLGLGLAAVAVVGGYFYFQPAAHAASTEKQLRQPQVGLATLDAYLTQKDSKSMARQSAPAWATAAMDFHDAAVQPGAPLSWRASKHFAEGRRLLLEGDLDAARKSFREASVVDTAWALPHVGLSAVSERRGEQAQALQAAQKAQRLDPKLWLAVRAGARAYLLGDKPNYASAILELQRAKQLAPESAILLGEIALAFHAAGLDPEADRYADLALKKDPELVGVRVLLAERALEKNNGKVALGQASRAVSIAPDNVSAHLAKGEALLLLGRNDEARSSFAEAVRLKRATKQVGAPNARLAEVEAALKNNRLPSPHGSVKSKGFGVVPRPKEQPRSYKPPAPADPIGKGDNVSKRSNGNGNSQL